MPTLNEIILKYRNNQLTLQQVENYLNSPSTTIEEINDVAAEHRNALFNAFLLTDDYLWEDEVEDENLVWDFSESCWEMSSARNETSQKSV